jgi:histidine ammonia-lyase
MIDVEITDAPLTLSELRRAWQDPLNVSLGPGARTRLGKSHEKVKAVLASGDQVYGVNTGFGLLANVRVSDDELETLQENLMRSHAVGLGELLPDATVRLVMLMKVRALAQGYSGVRPGLVEAICELLNHGIYPAIPKKG